MYGNRYFLYAEDKIGERVSPNPNPNYKERRFISAIHAAKHDLIKTTIKKYKVQ
jgi:hypothetical protein